MQTKRILAAVLSVGIMTAVSGCLSNGTGGGGGGGGTGSDFQTNFDAVSSRGPTSDMPTSLSGNYTGQFKLTTTGGSAELFEPGFSTDQAEITGELDIDVAWTEGQNTNPFSGTASNIVATEAGGGNSVALDGTLSVDDSQPYSLTRNHIPEQVIMGQTVPATDTGAFLFHMTGELSHGENTGDAHMQLGGTFFGPGGNAMVGSMSGGINDVDNPTPQVFDVGASGQFFTNKQ